VSNQPRRIAGRYEISPLDGGGMATVWRGYDTVLDRQVAIKQIRPDRHHSPGERRELAERFRREARVMAKIEHPGVPALYDAAIDRGIADDQLDRLYLVMQFVHGITLSDILAEHGPLPVEWAVAVTAQVCTVLSYAHAVPVVHRDLKPSNVMIDRDGTVKVLDFGVAAVLGTDVTRLTDTGRIIGSRDYMSPEQFHGTPVTPRSDLYAVGCLLHEMLTGGRVFNGTSDAALQHVHDPPPPVRQRRPDIPPDIEKLVLDLLAKAPDDRPPSARAVIDLLAPHLPHPDHTGSPPAGHTAPRTAPDPTRPYRRPLAPRRSDPAAPQPKPAPSTEPRADLPAQLAAADTHAAALIDDARFTQAARVAEDAIDAAAGQLPPHHPRLLDLRSTYAAALFLGGDYRRALHTFDSLAHAYKATAGPDDARIRDCRRQVAYCHAALGDVETAIAAFTALLDEEVRRTGTRGDGALELRRQIGILLLAAQRPGEAEAVLRPLHDDLAAAGHHHDTDLHDVRELLTRIRLMDDDNDGRQRSVP
jgi:eukaryotic-like serine/threonine-protein kinase